VSLPSRPTPAAVRIAAACVVAVSCTAVAAPAATAATATCRASSPSLTITWGAEDVLEWSPPDGFVQGRASRAIRDGVRLSVRTASSPASRRTPYLCAGRTAIARLPALRRGDRVVGASFNGDRVAWRTAKDPRRGALSVGRIRRGRVVGVRTTPTASTGRLRARDGRITVTPRGDVAWALSQRRGRRAWRSSAWAWPHRGRPTRIPLSPSERVRTFTLHLVDDQHLFVDGADRPHTFAPPRPGRCARPTVGAWQDVGPWRIRQVGDFWIEGEGEEHRDHVLVCETRSGRLVHTESVSSTSDHYCSTWNDVDRAAAIGPWLVLEHRRTQQGSYCGSRVVSHRSVGRNIATGETFEAPGGLTAPGAPPPVVDRDAPPGTPVSAETVDHLGAWPAVVLAPGALAWSAPATAPPTAPAQAGPRYTVNLADASGVRAVGTSTASSLAIDDAVRWTEAGVARSHGVVPVPGWQPTVTTMGPRP
jgi:hypothetical protein